MRDLDPTTLETALTPTVRGDGVARAARRTTGQVFTPPALATMVCREVLRPLWAGGAALRVLDPACGDGRFLAAAAAVLADAPRRGAPRHELIGIERDAAVAAACRARVPGAVVHVAEALLDETGVGAVDAVVGNPPYLRSIRLKASDPELWQRARGAFAATAHGEWDLYGAFIEASLGWVRPGGRIGLIVPSRWLTAVWARRLRGLLAARGAVRGVVDFGAAQVFAEATTYASIVVMERAAARARPTAVTMLRRAGDGRWERGELAAATLGEPAWIMPAPGGARRRSDGATLGEVARIAKGTGTNADGVYVLEDAVVDDRWVHGTALGAAVTVELAATRACWRGRDVQPGAVPRARCIVPYEDDGALVPWPALARRWPLAAAHLAAHRGRLEARERGRFAGAAFHVFGRPQNLAFHLDRAPKVIVPDVARTARAVLDTSGALVLDTAYALRPRPGAAAPWHDTDALFALCASPVLLTWLARAGVPLRGDYRRFKTAFLAPMPLPHRVPSPP